MRKFLSRVFVLAGMLAVAACGGGGDSKFETPGAGDTPGGGGGPTPAAITVTSSVPSISGSVTAEITALARDANNNLIANVPVTFTSTSGGIAITQATTDSSGAAKATLSTAGDATPRTITVTAASGTLSATVNVAVITGGGPAGSVQLGSGSGATFQPGVLTIATGTLSAGGSTSVAVNLVNPDGTLYAQSTDVTFNSPCIAAGTAIIQPSATATSTTGLVNVTYVAKGCSGEDQVTASAAVNGQALSATGAITAAPASVGSIVFVSATPTNIALQGTGDSNRPENSTVVFKVIDSSNNPISGATVTFALNTSVGGISHTPTTAVSNAQGLVQTVVSAGTVATSVKVTATVTSVTPNINTQSSQLTVTTGIPTAASFSLAVQCFNIEGWEIDGTTTAVTARLGDRFQNPVPDGTAVTFTAEGGNIQSQCTTGTTATEGGVCAVNFRSSEPRPADGRVTLLAKAIGEETFTDNNGNGAFDNGEPFVDLPEPYRDDNESLSYQAGEDFFDFNNNLTRDGPDGLFNGVLCNDTSGRCGAASTRSTGIGRQGVIIMSGSFATISQTDGSAFPSPAVTLNTNSAAPIAFWVRDVNGNPMPGGTTVTLSANGAGLSVATPASFSVPCAVPGLGAKVPDVTTFGFTVNSGATSGDGVITISVKTPGNKTTTMQLAVHVN